MLHQVITHSCYLSLLDTALAKIPLDNLDFHAHDIALFRMLDLDPAIPLLRQAYSHTGKPAKDPTILFRGLLLASRKCWGPKELVKQLRGHRILRALIGLENDDVPGVSTFYDFMKRLVPIFEHARIRTPFGRKTKPKNLGADGKIPDKKPKQRTTRITEKILEDKFSLAATPERTLQLIFKEVAIRPSLALNLIQPNPVVSGDGTCLRTGASSTGRKICECRKNGQYRCHCKRKFPDPLASIGWDSQTKSYYYGYTAFFMTTYSTKHKKDLPLSVRLVDAKRHDSLTALLALQEFRELYPEFQMSAFLADAAMDNYPTYSLLHEWEIPAIIDLNSHTNKRSSIGDITFDQKGTPICPAGLPMVYWGKWDQTFHTRIKFRCPSAAHKSCTCPLNECCNKKPYGRVFYTHSKEDLRLYPRIPRQSRTFKKLFKQRTATERINKQVLVDHGLETMKLRTKHRNFFYTVMACIDIHLKAQVSVSLA